MNIRNSVTRTFKNASAATKTSLGRLTGDRRMRNEGRVEKGTNTIERTADKVTDTFKK